MTEVAPSGGMPGVGDTIAGRYKITKLLGKGGMGVVYLARHELLRQNVAIKMVLPEVALDPVFVARFLNEARAAAGIRNEHVAQVLDVATLDSGAPYMVLEYLDGKDLSDILHEKPELPIETAVDWVLEALEAIAQAHALGIVHRDLKPSNLFLAKRQDGSEVVKVLDFGISKATNPAEVQDDAAVTNTQALLGSPGYMSPEQIRSSRNVDARADVWSIGVILYKLLTNKEPFVGETFGAVFGAIFSEDPVRTREHRADIPVALDDIVFRCLERERDRRYPNVAELASALGPYASASGVVSVARVRRTLASSATSSPGVTTPKATPAAVEERARSGTLESARAAESGAKVSPPAETRAEGAGAVSQNQTAMEASHDSDEIVAEPKKSRNRALLAMAGASIVVLAAVLGIVAGTSEKRSAKPDGVGLVPTEEPRPAVSSIPPASAEIPAVTAEPSASASASATTVASKPVVPVVPTTVRSVRPIAVKPVTSASAKPKTPDDSVLGGGRN